MIRVIVFLLFFFSQNVFALEDPSAELPAASIRTKLGEQLNLNNVFTNSLGQQVPLSSFFQSEKPVIIVPGYFTCPRLCGIVFGGVAKLVKDLKLQAGQDYQILTVSFDKRDTPEKAQAKEQEFLKLIESKTEDPESWKFLVGESQSLSGLMSELGFKYLKDKGEFAHSAAIYIITPDGQISQYFSGVSFNSFDVRLALVEASKGNIGSLIDQVLLFCFGFDHVQGKYVWLYQGTLRVGGILTILLIGYLLIKLWRTELKR